MDSFVGEIRAFGFNFPPLEWASCDGQTIPISQNSALYSVLGTAFGGDGVNTFALPNLQGRVPVGFGAGPGLSAYEMGQAIGASSVTLCAGNFPAHTHTVQAANVNATAPSAASNFPGKAVKGIGTRAVAVNVYAPAADSPSFLAVDSVSAVGSAPATVNRNTAQPYLPVLLCVSLYGAYPSRP